MNGSGIANKEFGIAVAICMALAAMAQGVPREFAADVTRPRTFQTECYRGETLEIAARLTDGGRPYAVPAGASAAMLVSTNGADWWEWPASVTTGGVVSATWEPRMDSGAAAHRIFLGVSEGGTNRNYGANMLLRMLGSPGETPNALPLPARRIDFALVSVTNAPWTTPADIPDVAAMTASVARSATNHADEVASAVAVAATNHADAVGAAVAVATTNHADAVGAAVAQAATNHADAVGAAVAASIPGTVSNLVTKGFVEDLGVEAGTDGATVTNIVRDMAVTSVNGQTGAVSLSLKDVDEYGVLSGIPNYSSPLASNTKGEIVQYLAPYNSLLFGDHKGEIVAYEAPAGMLKGDKGDIESATAGVDYVAPADLAASELRSTNYTDAAVSAVARGVPGAISNVVTKTYVESLGIEAGIDGAGVSNIVTKSYVEGLGIEAGVSGQAVTNIVDAKIADMNIDQEALNRAVQVGEDLALIDADTNGWHIAVSNVVETDQAHIHGALILGGTIYGAPENREGRIDLDGCDFFYNRQIPGDTTQTNGYGNIVTDPYLMWWARDFFASFAATNAAMWNAIATIHDLPATLGNDLQAYNSITASVQTATAQVTAMRNEVNATNAVIRQAIAQALSQASGGGGSAWTSSENSDGSITLSDHEICVCSYSGSSIGIAPPMWSGAPSHCMVFFTSAYDWQSSSPSIYIDSSASVYHDEYDSAGSYYSNGGLYLFDIWQLSEWHIFIRVCPVGYAYL